MPGKRAPPAAESAFGWPVQAVGEASNLLAAAGVKQQGFGAVTQANVEVDADESGDRGSMHKQNLGENSAVTVIPEFVSKKIKVLLLFGTMCVLYIHFGIDRRVRILIVVDQLVSHGLLQFSVPLFFMISGYLFFARRADDFPSFKFGRRIRSRVPSLVYPFVLWNLISIGLSLAISAAQPGCTACLSPVTSSSVLLQMWTTPVTVQLWYLRDLFACGLLSPVLLAIYSWSPSALLACVSPAYVLWLSSPSMYYFTGVNLLEFEAQIFFPLGGYLALRGVDMGRKVGLGTFLGFLVPWVGLVVCKATVAFVYDIEVDTSSKGQQVAWINLLIKLSIPFGVVSVWFGYDRLEPFLRDKQVWAWCSWLSSFAMWLYCAHLPLACGGSLFLINLMLAHGVESQGWYLALYVVYPLLCSALVLAAGAAMSRYSSSAFALLTGGRGG